MDGSYFSDSSEPASKLLHAKPGALETLADDPTPDSLVSPSPAPPRASAPADPPDVTPAAMTRSAWETALFVDLGIVLKAEEALEKAADTVNSRIKAERGLNTTWRVYGKHADVRWVWSYFCPHVRYWYNSFDELGKTVVKGLIRKFDNETGTFLPYRFISCGTYPKLLVIWETLDKALEASPTNRFMVTNFVNTGKYDFEVFVVAEAYVWTTKGCSYDV